MSKKILIAGGGIGGLAAALALIKKGFEVEIYEQAQEFREVGAGIQISPNGNRALDTLGVFHALRALSCDADEKQIRLWNTGATWKLFDLGTEAVERYGYPYLTVYRPDLLKVLADAVKVFAPRALHLESKVKGITQKDGKVILHLEDGRDVEGDALIGADGVHSRVRQELWGESKAQFSGMMAWRGVMPMNKLPPHLGKMMASNWIGPGAHVVCYPLRGGELFNFVATVHRDDWLIESWTTEGTREECAQDFAGWHEDVQTMIATAPRLFKWALCGRDNVGAALQRYEKARIDITRRKVLGASANTSRFHNDALSNEVSAKEYVDREWSREAILDRYEWIFTYDVNKTPI